MLEELWPQITHPVIGMLHAPPLAGAPRYGGNWEQVRQHVLADAAALAEGGVDGLMLENFGDTPFFPHATPPWVVAQMSALACAVRQQTDLPLGVNVLRNDGLAALSVALAAEAQFIRVNVLCGARVSDQGVIHGIAHDLLRQRASLGASTVRIFADVDVKHSAPIAPRPLAEEVEELVERGGADALVVSGTRTGGEVDIDHLRTVKTAAGTQMVWVGSGANANSISRLALTCDGFIIGTAFQRDDGVVECERVVEVMSALRGDG